VKTLHFDFTTVLAFFSVPCILLALVVWKLHRWEAERRKLDEARKEFDSLVIDFMCATFALGEATAKAVKIDNPKSNGEMTEALRHAKKLKHEQRKFLQGQGLNHLH